MKKAWFPLLLAVLLTLALGSLVPVLLPAASQATEPELPGAQAPPVELPADLALEEPVELADGCTAETTCSTGAVISCSAGPGAICGSNPGWDVFCGSCSISCSNSIKLNQCIADCDAAFDVCVSGCTVFIPCVSDCADARNRCWNRCRALYPLSCTG